ncbi:hypothetical protein M2480_001328 [Parabacteroides sp. PFB2-12]|uniref:hypothetical protein n=1 Tax=unclassified Parabacteroides TaxID=2649774 RepID=UPI0024750AEB|nr:MULTISPECIES: hypothetical protein [unclassified Parabacteroides]MDH6343339.1 hypothetical protein [Parabacteroides sp. PM6-13]MDH6390355.1 hypothetical protein [Parabacteroides sp. PFB2-12]
MIDTNKKAFQAFVEQVKPQRFDEFDENYHKTVEKLRQKAESDAQGNDLPKDRSRLPLPVTKIIFPDGLCTAESFSRLSELAKTEAQYLENHLLLMDDDKRQRYCEAVLEDLISLALDLHAHVKKVGITENEKRRLFNLVIGEALLPVILLMERQNIPLSAECYADWKKRGIVKLVPLMEMIPKTDKAEPATPKKRRKVAPTTSEKGRPVVPFRECVYDDNEPLITELHRLLKGKKGKDVALVIQACIAEGLITRPTYTAVRDEFGDIGNKSGYNSYLGAPDSFTKVERDTVRGLLRPFKTNHPRT